MKAFGARAYGGPEVMGLVDLPDPTPGKGEVVVAVHATSVNPVDWKVRNGVARVITGRRFPKVYGCDLAGIVETVGPGVEGLAAGDAVYGAAAVMFGRPGAHAEKVAIGAKRLRRLPEAVTFEQAAAVPIAGLTAQNGLTKCGELSGKRVLVNGATGGVGHFVVQLAKAAGSHVTAVCSAPNAEQAKTLGADAIIDYRAQDFTRGVDRYDVVFDAFGQLPFAAARGALVEHGVYVTTLGGPGLFLRGVWQRLTRGPGIAFANVAAKPQDYAALEARLAAGLVRPLIARVFPLEQAAEAFATLERGGTAGKIIIRVAS